jgi:hypothetical protein
MASTAISTGISFGRAQLSARAAFSEAFQKIVVRRMVRVRD